MRDRARIRKASPGNWVAFLLGLRSITAWWARDNRWWFGHRRAGRRHYLDIGRIVVSWIR